MRGKIKDISQLLDYHKEGFDVSRNKICLQTIIHNLWVQKNTLTKISSLSKAKNQNIH